LLVERGEDGELFQADETADAIRALDEHWDGHGQPEGLAGEAIPLLGRNLQLAQTTEVFFGADGVRLTDEDQLDRVTEAFADVIEAKSPRTYRHSTVVARYSVGIAAELGLDAAAQRRLRRAALLHDLSEPQPGGQAPRIAPASVNASTW